MYTLIIQQKIIITFTTIIITTGYSLLLLFLLLLLHSLTTTITFLLILLLTSKSISNLIFCKLFLCSILLTLELIQHNTFFFRNKIVYELTTKLRQRKHFTTNDNNRLLNFSVVSALIKKDEEHNLQLFSYQYAFSLRLYLSFLLSHVMPALQDAKIFL